MLIIMIGFFNIVTKMEVVMCHALPKAISKVMNR